MKSLFRFIILFWIVSIAVVSSAQTPVVSDWAKNIKNSLNSINKSSSLRIDKQGNCYVLGTTWYSDSAKDILLIKINPEGEEEWRRTYDNPAHGDDIPLSMCLDNFGNVWVCGMAKLKKDNADFLVVRFTPDGIPDIHQLYDGRDHLFDCAISVVADKQGNVYAGGYETSLDSGINMLVIKFKADGTQLWKRGYSTRQMDVANQLLADDSCNVYLCGTVNNGPHSSDILVQKYDSSGRKKWQLVYDGVLSQNDAGQFISLDDSVNLYVTGFMNHSNNRSDIPLIKLNRNGQLLQENLFNGHIADCGATNVNATHNTIFLIGNCNDYNISQITTFLVCYDKGGTEKRSVIAPEGVQFLRYDESTGMPLIFGAKTTHPENTLIPFIAQYDTNRLSWMFSDSTIFGLAHITYVEVKNNNVYFLGDDTGDATGTISIFKYMLSPETEKKKPPPKKRK